MRAANFVRLKGRTTYFRRRVPAALVSRIGRRELSFPIGTVSSRRGEELGRRMAVATDRLFVRFEEEPDMTPADTKLLLRTTYEEIIASQDRNDGLLASGARKHPLPPRQDADALADTASDLVKAYDARIYAIGDELCDRAYKLSGVQRPTDPYEATAIRGKMSLVIALRLYERAIAVAERHGLDRNFFGRPATDVTRWQRQVEVLSKQLLLDDTPAADTAQATPLFYPVSVPQPAHTPHDVPGNAIREVYTHAPIVNPPNVDSSSLRPEMPRQRETPIEEGQQQKFSELLEPIMASRVAENLIAADWKRDVKSSFRIWIEAAGDHPLTSYNRASMRRFRDTAISIPKVYWRSEESRQKSITDIIETARLEDENYPRIALVTVNRHLSAIAAFMEYAQKNGYVDENTNKWWNGFHIEKPDNLNDEDRRPSFNKHHIKDLFAHPIYTGRQSDYMYNQSGQCIVRDSLYYSFLIALYHMMRRAEFAQLKVKHVRQEVAEIWEGDACIDSYKVWIFDLTDPNLKIKRQRGRRVPLHKMFLTTSFLDEFVHERDPDEPLFPDLWTTADDGPAMLADRLGKRAGRVIEACGIVLERIDGSTADGVYHPLRHFGSTELQGIVNSTLIDQLTGHSPQPTGRAPYIKAKSLHELKTAIDRLKVPLNIEALEERWKCAKAGGTALLKNVAAVDEDHDE